MKTYISDVKIIFSGNLFGILTGIGVQSCLGWFLLLQGRGQYAACQVFISLLTLAFTLGQEMANVYFIGSKKMTVIEIMNQSLFIGMISSLCACTVGYFLTLSSFSFLGVASVRLYRISLLSIPTTIFFLYFSRIFLGLSDISSYTILSILPNLLVLIGFVFARIFVVFNVENALIIQAASQGIPAVIAFGILCHRFHFQLNKINISSLFCSINYGFRFYIGKFCSMANVQIGTIFLTLSAVNPDQIGLFSAGSLLASRIWLFSDTLQVALLPRSSSNPNGEVYLIAQSIRICLAFCAIITGLIFILSKPLIMIFLSPKFLPILVPFWLILPGVLIRIVSKILPAYFNGINCPQITSYATGLSVLINFILMHFLLPIWGLVGIAVSTSVSYLVEALFMSLFFKHIGKLPLSSLFIIQRNDIRIMKDIIYNKMINMRKKMVVSDAKNAK